MVAVVVLCLVVALGLVRLRSLRARICTLEAEALTDPLTGAFNRRYMNRCLATAIERRHRVGERTTLLLFDIDRFKEINDAAGHRAGDEVLKALVALVGRRLRQIDALCRVGGEEFALVLARASFVDGLDVAEQLRVLVEGTAVAGRPGVSISLGVAELQPGQSAVEWLDGADAALYAAKRSGRNCVAGRDCSGQAVRYEHEGRTVRVSVVI